MYLNLTDDEQISLSLKEISILTVLASGPASGYNIARHYAADTGQAIPLSSGSLFPTLRRLKLYRLIDAAESPSPLPSPGKSKIIYALSPIGHLVLEQQIETLKAMAHRAQERLTDGGVTSR